MCFQPVYLFLFLKYPLSFDRAFFVHPFAYEFYICEEVELIQVSLSKASPQFSLVQISLTSTS